MKDKPDNRPCGAKWSCSRKLASTRFAAISSAASVPAKPFDVEEHRRLRKKLYGKPEKQ